MAVALKSLRVTVDGDAGGYTRMAAAKVDADNKMIAGDRARAAAMAQADAALAKQIPGVGGLSKALLDGYGAGAQFEAIVRRIGAAVDRGMGLDRADALLEGAYRKFGLTADATALAERGFVSIVPAVDAMNARMAAAAENARRLEAQLGARAFQQGINAQFGIGQDNSASRSADIAALGASLDNLRAKYSPLFSLQRDYLSTLKELNSIEARTALTENERAAAITRAKQAFAASVIEMRAAPPPLDQIGQSGSTAAQKLGQLSLQVNDVMSGLVSGQSPLTILAQQGTQVSQIFTSGATTVAGALAAIGGVTAIAGIVAVASAMAKLRTEMGELADMAIRTRTSTAELQLLQGSALYRGVSRDESAAATQALAAGLNQALKYSTELSQLFAQNGASLRTQSGDAKGLVDVLSKGADFVRNARTEQDKLLIVQQLGLAPTAEMVKYLEQGSVAIKLAMEDARLAGGVIDERLIRSAQSFDQRWNTATTNISLRMRAWLAETGESFDRLAESKFLSRVLTVGSMIPIVGAPFAVAQLGVNAYNAVAGGPKSSGGIDPQRRLEGSFQLLQAENDRIASGNRTKLTADTQRLLGIESQRIGLLGATATVGEQLRAAEIGLDQAHLNGIEITDRQRAAVLALAREQALGITAMKAQADATRIQSETLGKSTGAAAEYIAVQTRLAEALRNRQVLTELDILQIKAQAAALGQATQAAELARVHQDIKFGAQTALLSPEDVQIAQQLKGIYPDVTQALNSVEASAMRPNRSLVPVNDNSPPNAKEETDERDSRPSAA